MRNLELMFSFFTCALLQNMTHFFVLIGDISLCRLVKSVLPGVSIGGGMISLNVLSDWLIRNSVERHFESMSTSYFSINVFLLHFSLIF